MIRGDRELNLRRLPVGGPVAAKADATPPRFWLGKRRLVLLIHGFNTTRDGGRESYADFEVQLSRFGAAADAIRADLVWCLWPGDAGLGRISPLFYPRMIRPAKETARLLAHFLSWVRGPEGKPVEIWLVCHSLGNRVALELMRRLDAAPLPNVVISRICLMAPAVPIEMVYRDGRFARAPETPHRVLFSPKDSALGWVFRSGQFLARESTAEAVGLHGNPYRWADRRQMHLDATKGYDHNDYWQHAPTVDQVLPLFGVPLAQRLPGAGVLENRTADSRFVGSSRIPSHGLPAPKSFW